MSSFDKLKQLAVDTVTSYSEGIPSRSAAALAYRGVFSLAPLLFIATLIVGIFVGQETAQDQISEVVGMVVDEEAASMVDYSLRRMAWRTDRDYTVASVAALLFMVYAASALFKELKIALHSAWGLPPTPRKGPLAFIFTQITAVVMVLLVGFFFLALLLINVAISLLDSYIFQGDLISLRWASLVASLLAIALLIGLVYRLVPDVSLPWSDLWVGALVTALLMAIGLWGISIYLSFSNVGSAFGAAGTIVILMLWLYYTAYVFLFGASFAQAYALNFGSKKATEILEQFEDETAEPDSETADSGS